MPPGRGAPQPVWPVAVIPQEGALAPIPINDRFPIVVGQSLTVTYLSSVFRLANSGYRQQYVDLLCELLEQDPHLFSVVTKRILSSSVGRVEIVAAKLPNGHPDTEKAQEVRDLCDAEIQRIPNLCQSLTELLWAVYFGISSSEIYWNRDSDGWHIDRLGFIHSRRLSYPSYESNALHVWDQGMVYGFSSPFDAATNRAVFGLRVADYPGKFIVHTPQLRGDYPWRDGIGRQVASWSVFKRVGARGAVQYLERFAKGFMDVTYKTYNDDNSGPREATTEDINLARTIAAAIGPGSGSLATHADSIEINSKSFDGGSSSKLTWQDWISICNSEQSKAALGGTLGTEVGKTGGAYALGEVQERGEITLEQYDANNLGESIKRDCVAWLVRLNRPDCVHLVPSVRIHVDPDPAPGVLADLAKKLSEIGAPVDIDELADRVGVPLVPRNSTDKKPQPRRSYLRDITEVVKTLTQVDYPVDLDKLADMVGVPIVPEDELETARRSRLITGGKDTPVEPDGSNDPNSPDYEPPEPVDETKTVVKTKKTGAKPGGSASKPGGSAGKPGSSAEIQVKGEAAADKASAKPVTDEVEASNRQIRAALFLLKDAPGNKEAIEVFDQLLEDYPERALGWVVKLDWRGPQAVALEDVDFSTRKQWRASHEPIDPYVDKITAGRMKPVILVRRPGNPKLMIVDGHHRTLAYEKMGMPVLAYVAAVPSDDGPWSDLHAAQKKGTSKGSWFDPASSQFDPSYIPQLVSQQRGASYS